MHEVGGRSIVQRCQQKFNNTGDKESCREGIWWTKKHNSHCDKDKYLYTEGQANRRNEDNQDN